MGERVFGIVSVAAVLRASGSWECGGLCQMGDVVAFRWAMVEKDLLWFGFLFL
jgi:hypothetical protein